MREIKFRAWHKKVKDMFPVRTLDVFGSLVCFVTREQYEKHKDKKWGIWFPSEVTFGQTPPYNYELMQYTGIKDKNSKEIYEGDLVQVCTWDDTGINQTLDLREVTYVFRTDIYNLGAFSLACRKEIKKVDLSLEEMVQAQKEIEVVGNIYENPELLLK